MSHSSHISSDFLLSSQATLKKYQSERRSKSESIERCQSQLKKLRRKSQGSRHPNKYGDREMQVTNVHKKTQHMSCRWMHMSTRELKLAFDKSFKHMNSHSMFQQI